MFLSTYEGEEGEIHLPHLKYAQHWCDKKVSGGRRVVSCFCNKSGILFMWITSRFSHRIIILLNLHELIICILIFQIQNALKQATFDSNSQIGAIFQVLHTKESPPTYFRTNKFTLPFQEIVDAYGWVNLRLLMVRCVQSV